MADTLTCPMCGFENQAGIVRCVSCGAKMEAFGAGEYTEEEALARRFEQENFEWKWAGIACGIYLALQLVVLVIFPFIISAFETPHSPHPWFSGPIDEGVHLPARAPSYRAGDNYSFLLEHPQGNVLIVPSANLVAEKFDGISADIVFLGIGTLGKQDTHFTSRYWHEVVEATGRGS